MILDVLGHAFVLGSQLRLFLDGTNNVEELVATVASGNATIHIQCTEGMVLIRI
jgi:hypothetical protein